MLELHENRLKFSFTKLHPEAEMSLEFQRTLRIPDDDVSPRQPPLPTLAQDRTQGGHLGSFPHRLYNLKVRFPSWRLH